MHEELEVKQVEELNEFKVIILWLLGTLFVFTASWIAGHLEWVYGTTPISFWFSAILAFILFMAGSFLWIVVAILVVQSRV